MRPARHYDLPGADIRPLWESTTGRLAAVAARKKFRGLSAARSAEAHRRLAEEETSRITRKGNTCNQKTS